MNAAIYSVVERAGRWTVEVDGAPVLSMQSREQAITLAAEAARLLASARPKAKPDPSRCHAALFSYGR